MVRNIVSISLIVVVVLTASALAPGATVLWQAGTGDWSVDANWDGGEPVSGDVTSIRNGGTAQVTSSGEITYDLTVGYQSGEVGTLDISGGSLTVEHYLTLARYGTGASTVGTVNMTGGTISAVREYIGDGAGANGGVFNHSGGTNTVSDYLPIGDDASSTGAYNLSGTGILNLTGSTAEFGMTVGNNGTGTFNQTGGTINGDRKVKVGRYGTGTYAISGGTMDVFKLEISDNVSGSGTFKVTGDDATINLDWYVSRGGNGTLVSELDADGLSTINVTDKALLSGTWNVTDLGAVAGTYNVLVAADGFDGTSFDTVNLPSDDWSWGIDGGTTLYVEYIPEPATLSLLLVGGLAVLVKRNRK